MILPGSMNNESDDFFGSNNMDPLFAPINGSDLDSIFAEDPTPVPVFEARIWETNNGHGTTVHPYTTFDFHPLVAQTSSLMNYQDVPERIPSDEVLGEVLDELDHITSDLGPDEIAAVSSDSAMSPLLTPFVSMSPSFKHLRPCPKPKRRVVSDESSCENQVHSQTSPEVKRTRVDKDSDDSDGSDIKFRLYQAEKWHVKFKELVEYKQLHGHCQVPHGYKPNPTLARWAKRQRYQFKLFQEKKPSTMTEERITDLEKLGFVWDSHTALWDERYRELKEYVQSTGSANVPSTYPPNPKLAIWVKCQRRQYKLLVSGQPSNMTHARVDLLNELNFIWEIRRTGYLS